jgi:hypothetical protein
VRLVTAGQEIVPGQVARLIGIEETAGNHRGGDRSADRAAALAVDPELIAAFGIAADLDDPVAISRFGILLPQHARLSDMTVRVDYSGHQKRPPGKGLRSVLNERPVRTVVKLVSRAFSYSLARARSLSAGASRERPARDLRIKSGAGEGASATI